MSNKNKVGGRTADPHPTTKINTPINPEQIKDKKKLTTLYTLQQGTKVKKQIKQLTKKIFKNNNQKIKW